MANITMAIWTGAHIADVVFAMVRRDGIAIKIEKPVGWVERSETHRCGGGISEDDGFRCALPTLQRIAEDVGKVSPSRSLYGARIKHVLRAWTT